MSSWSQGIYAITLFVEDLPATKKFYITVDDVDAMCAELTQRGVELLNGPLDRPWGVRTASFRDPGGHIWEIAK